MSWWKRREKYSNFITRKLQQHGLGCFEEQLGQMANSEGRKGNDLSSAAVIEFKSGECVWKVTRLQRQVHLSVFISSDILLLFDTANYYIFFILIHTCTMCMCIHTPQSIYTHMYIYMCAYIYITHKLNVLSLQQNLLEFRSFSTYILRPKHVSWFLIFLNLGKKN